MSSVSGPKPLPESTLRRAVVVGLGTAGAALLGVMLWPFAPAIAASAAIATIVFPVYQRYERWLGGRRSIAAFTGTAVVFLLGIVPAFSIGLVVANQVAIAIEFLREGARGLLTADGAVSELVEGVAVMLGVDPSTLSAPITAQLDQMARSTMNVAFNFLTGLGTWLLQAAVAVFTLYYLLKDGEAIVGFFKRMLPLEVEQGDRLVSRAREVIHATIFGNVLVALVQGSLGGAALAFAGIPGAALWGTVMGVLSLIPFLGPPVVYIPTVTYLFMNDRVGTAIGLLIFGVLVISTVDNVLRAALVSGRAQIHPLVAFFSVLGGIGVFGPIGVLVGPVFVISAYMLLRLALEAMAVPPPALAEPRASVEPGD